jgi:hypothetical protein
MNVLHVARTYGYKPVVTAGGRSPAYALLGALAGYGYCRVSRSRDQTAKDVHRGDGLLASSICARTLRWASR